MDLKPSLIHKMAFDKSLNWIDFITFKKRFYCPDFPKSQTSAISLEWMKWIFFFLEPFRCLHKKRRNDKPPTIESTHTCLTCVRRVHSTGVVVVFSQSKFWVSRKSGKHNKRIIARTPCTGWCTATMLMLSAFNRMYLTLKMGEVALQTHFELEWWTNLCNVEKFPVRMMLFSCSTK